MIQGEPSPAHRAAWRQTCALLEIHKALPVFSQCSCSCCCLFYSPAVQYKGEDKLFAPEEISSMVLVKMKEVAQVSEEGRNHSTVRDSTWRDGRSAGQPAAWVGLKQLKATPNLLPSCSACLTLYFLPA